MCVCVYKYINMVLSIDFFTLFEFCSLVWMCQFLKRFFKK